MTQSVQYRKATSRRRPSGSARPLPAARPVKKRRLSRRYATLLLAMTYGSTVALLVVTVGFTSLIRDAAQGPPGALQQAGAQGNDHANHSGATPNIRIEARHLGNLVMEIRAEVSMNKDSDPLIKAKVAAFTDMVQMPQVHAQGPLPLEPVSGEPGVYQTMVKVTMPGDYKVRVAVEDPVQGEKTTTVPVDALYGKGPTSQSGGRQ